MTDQFKNVRNIDPAGNIRGKCNNPICECDEYMKTDLGTCMMCGCHPGKHAKVQQINERRAIPSVLTVATNELTPSKVAEIDIETGAVEIHKLAETALFKVQNASKKLKLFDSSPEDIIPSLNEFVDLPDCDGLRKGADEPTNKMEDGEEILSDEVVITAEQPGTSKSSREKVAVTSNRNKEEARAPRFSDFQINKNFVSVDLQTKINDVGVLAKEDLFVAEAASYLLSLIKDENNKPTAKETPTQAEFDIFCSKMVQFYPELQSNLGTKRWSALKSMLSRHLIQRRYRAKNAKGSKNTKTITSCALVVSDEEDEQNETEPIEKKLEKLKGVTPQTPEREVQALITSTSTARRALMYEAENANLTPKNLIEMWPHLSKVQWLIYDFFNLKGITEEQFNEQATVFLKRLAKMDKREEEHDKIFLESLYSFTVDMMATRQSKKLSNILSIVEPLGSLDNLKPLKDESPRLVVCVTKEGDILQCFLIFDLTRLEVEDPTPQRALASLMAAYYIFDVKYPQPYLKCLLVLDKELLHKADKIKASYRTIASFYSKFDKITL